jgi:hypothetical protein
MGPRQYPGLGYKSVIVRQPCAVKRRFIHGGYQ